MPEKRTREAARRRRCASAKAGEFLREEIHHVREGKHGARSAKQVIAIGLSKARRAGVKLAPPRPGTTSAETRKRAVRDLRHAGRNRPVSPRRSRATLRALRHEGRAATSTKALSRHATSAARRRGARARSRAARKAVRAKDRAVLVAAGRKAARTRARRAARRRDRA
jgi:hypothetical protein